MVTVVFAHACLLAASIYYPLSAQSPPHKCSAGLAKDHSTHLPTMPGEGSRPQPTASAAASGSKLRNRLPFNNKKDKTDEPRKRAQDHLDHFEDVIRLYGWMSKMAKGCRRVEGQAVPGHAEIARELLGLCSAMQPIRNLKRTVLKVLEGLKRDSCAPLTMIEEAEKQWKSIEARQVARKPLSKSSYTALMITGSVNPKADLDKAKSLLGDMKRAMAEAGLVHKLDEFLAAVKQIYIKDQHQHIKAIEAVCEHYKDAQHRETFFLKAIRKRTEFAKFRTVTAFKLAESEGALPAALVPEHPPEYRQGDNYEEAISAAYEADARHRFQAYGTGLDDMPESESEATTGSWRTARSEVSRPGSSYS